MSESLRCRNSDFKWDNVEKTRRICPYFKKLQLSKATQFEPWIQSVIPSRSHQWWMNLCRQRWMGYSYPSLWEVKQTLLVIHLLLLWSNETAWTMDLVYPCSLTIPSVHPLPPIADTHFFPEVYPAVHQLGCTRKGDTCRSKSGGSKNWCSPPAHTEEETERSLFLSIISFKFN